MPTVQSSPTFPSCSSLISLPTSLPILRVVTDKNEIITFVNEEFVQFTGYSESEVLGTRCNFLQGEHTGFEAKEEIRRCLSQKPPKRCSVVILNYKKKGNPFWNLLTIRPIFENSVQKQSALCGYTADLVILPLSLDRVMEWASTYPSTKTPLTVADALSMLASYSAVPKALNAALAENVELPQNLHFSKEEKTTRPRARTWSFGKESKNVISSLPKPGDLLQGAHASASTVAATAAASLEATSKSNVAPPRTPPKTSPKVPDFVFVAETLLPTSKGLFRLRAYRASNIPSPPSKDEHQFFMVEGGNEPIAMIVGDVKGLSRIPIRVHDQCLTSEVFGSLKCDCKQQLDYSLKFMQENSPGMVIYLPQEGRGIGLANKVAAYAEQEKGHDTVDANRVLGLPDDARVYNAVKDILNDLEVKSILLMSNNPRKIQALEALGIKVDGRLPCIVAGPAAQARNYLATKVRRMGHMIDCL
eukprot:g5028.t1